MIDAITYPYWYWSKPMLMKEASGDTQPSAGTMLEQRHYSLTINESNRFPSYVVCWWVNFAYQFPDSKVHGANMGPVWGRQDPCWPQVGPMNFAIWVILIVVFMCCFCYYQFPFITFAPTYPSLDLNNKWPCWWQQFWGLACDDFQTWQTSDWLAARIVRGLFFVRKDPKVEVSRQIPNNLNITNPWTISLSAFRLASDTEWIPGYDWKRTCVCRDCNSDL